MPEDQRPPSPGALAAEDALAHDEVSIRGRIVDSSNGALVVELESGPLAIYKPEAFERPLHDFPRGLWRRERASLVVARALGLDFVPPVVVREDLPFGIGSLQSFVDADFMRHYFHLVEDERFIEQLVAIATFDLVANNADRKAGHILVDADERLWAIDNALCFHQLPKLRTVIWEFGGLPIPPTLRARMHELADQPPQELDELLRPAERTALVRRARAVAALASLPALPEDERPYPWPLV
jgi:uncharacterized repeat protein (TIGR03843 family)